MTISSSTRITFGCGRTIRPAPRPDRPRPPVAASRVEHRLQLPLHPRHELGKLVPLARRQPRQRIVDRAVRNLCQAQLDQIGLVRQVKPVDAAVGAIGAALDPALRLHPVDHAAGGRLLDFEHLGELGLRRSRPPVQAVDHQPLRAGQAELSHPPVKRRPKQPRDIGDQKTDMALVIAGHRAFPNRMRSL
jgi:hypothetical protein